MLNKQRNLISDIEIGHSPQLFVGSPDALASEFDIPIEAIPTSPHLSHSMFDPSFAIFESEHLRNIHCNMLLYRLLQFSAR